MPYKIYERDCVDSKELARQKQLASLREQKENLNRLTNGKNKLRKY